MTDLQSIDLEVETARAALDKLRHRTQPNIGVRHGVTHDLSVEDMRALAAAEKHLEVALHLQHDARGK